MKLRLAGSKTRNFCPSEAKVARFQASLSSPFGRGTVPAQPSNGFFTRCPSQRVFSVAGENERAPNLQHIAQITEFEILAFILFPFSKEKQICYNSKK
jgi:hypothetical protein